MAVFMTPKKLKNAPNATLTQPESTTGARRDCDARNCCDARTVSDARSSSGARGKGADEGPAR